MDTLLSYDKRARILVEGYWVMQKNGRYIIPSHKYYAFLKELMSIWDRFFPRPKIWVTEYKFVSK